MIFGIHLVLQIKVDGAKQNLIIGLGIHQILPAGHEVNDG